MEIERVVNLTGASNVDWYPSKGLAVTSLKYRIKTTEEFLRAMKEMKRIGHSDGAIRWNLLRDSGPTKIESLVLNLGLSIYASTKESPPTAKQSKELKPFISALTRLK
jgi:hypothetical protein